MMLIDSDAVVLQALREHFTGYTFGTLRPADLLDHLPFVLVTRIGGAAGLPSWRASAVHVDRPTYTLQAWAGPDLADARSVCRDCLHALTLLRGAVIDSATITVARIVSGPIRVPDTDSPADVHRVAGSILVTVRA